MTTVQRVVNFPNRTGAILDYLIQRTDYTIGKKISESDLILTGVVKKTNYIEIEVQKKDLFRLTPWIIEKNDRYCIEFIQTTIKVEQVFIGTFPEEELLISYPLGPDINTPVFEEAGLFFLVEIDKGKEYSSYITAYQLSPGETGIHSYIAQKSGENNPEVSRIIDALIWYSQLPENKKEKEQAFIAAINHPNSYIQRHSIRALARSSCPQCYSLFSDTLEDAPEDVRIRLILAICLLGYSDEGVKLLEEIFQHEDRTSWLQEWGIQITQSPQGGDLYGPDPSEAKRD